MLYLGLVRFYEPFLWRFWTLSKFLDASRPKQPIMTKTENFEPLVLLL